MQWDCFFFCGKSEENELVVYIITCIYFLLNALIHSFFCISSKTLSFCDLIIIQAYIYRDKTIYWFKLIGMGDFIGGKTITYLTCFI